VETATYQARDYFTAGVARIVWDHARKAFWCLSKDGRLALFYLSREYGLSGWSEYLFDDTVGIGTGEDRIRDVFIYQNKMCVSTKDQIFQFEAPEFEGVQRDLETAHIDGEMTFLKHAPAGTQGDSEGAVKSVGSTTVKGRNIASLTAITPDENRTEVALTPEVDGDAEVNTFDASSYVSQARLPLLAMKYRAGQDDTKKAIILNTSSRYVIGEE